MASDPQDSQGNEGLQGQVWQLERFDNQTVALDPAITVEFDRQRVTGSGGCNQYSADISYLPSGGLQVGRVISTKKACLGGATMSTEAAFYGALESVVRHSFEEGKLNLFYTRGGAPSGRLVFRQAGQ
jgi:heat shock protein HslJ